VHIEAQPRIDVLVTDFETEDRRLRTDHAGVAWLGDEPDPDSGMLGPDYTKREVESRLFLPDTHWYDVEALDGVEVQVTAGVLQVAPTKQGTQGILGSLAAPEIEFYEHPDGGTGVGVCLCLRGEIRSNVGVSYRVTLVCDPAAVLRRGAYLEDGADDAASLPLLGEVLDS
jgi:hypothetical protein